MKLQSHLAIFTPITGTLLFVLFKLNYRIRLSAEFFLSSFPQNLIQAAIECGSNKCSDTKPCPKQLIGMKYRYGLR
jgi:hypothetical protein